MFGLEEARMEMRATSRILFFLKLMTELLWVLDGWAAEIMEVGILAISMSTAVSTWRPITPWKLLGSGVRRRVFFQPLWRMNSLMSTMEMGFIP